MSRGATSRAFEVLHRFPSGMQGVGVAHVQLHIW